MDPRTDIVAVAALLLAARTVVADSARWCAYPHALDANGHSCEGRANKAVCWGAAGALDRAATDAKAAGHGIAEARRQLNQTAHGCIVHAFDIAVGDADADRHCDRRSSGRARGKEYAR